MLSSPQVSAFFTILANFSLISWLNLNCVLFPFHLKVSSVSSTLRFTVLTSSRVCDSSASFEFRDSTNCWAHAGGELERCELACDEWLCFLLSVERLLSGSTTNPVRKEFATTKTFLFFLHLNKAGERCITCDQKVKFSSRRVYCQSYL